MPESPEAVEALVALCLEQVGRERAAVVADACRRHPELAAKLTARLAWLDSIGLSAAPQAGPLPERLGDFRILARLGGGGMGVVHLAEQESLGRQVALKTIRPEQRWFPGARDRFEREIRTVAQLKHPAIVPIYAVGEEDGVPYFAMEWIEGLTLAELLVELAGRDPATLLGRDAWLALSRRRATAGGAASDDGPLPALFAGTWTEFVARVAHAIADALAHTHGAGILHRDVKPSNVMVTRDGRALLLDFGLASTAEVDRITKAGTPLGSLPYMAPEQLRGAAVDARSDVWSLGATTYELLSFTSPFLATNAALTAGRIARGDARRLRAVRRGIPWELEVIVAATLEVDPARRFATAGALRDDLARFLAHEPIQARAPGALRLARRFAQRRPAVAVALLLGAFVVVVLPGVLWLQEHRARLRIERESDNVSRISSLLRELLAATGPDRSPAEQVPIDELLTRFEQRLDTEFPGEPRLRGELLAILGRVRSKRFESAKAAAALREAIDLLEANRAGDFVSTIYLRGLLVDNLAGMGEVAAAEALATETLASKLLASDPDYGNVLLSLRGTLRGRLGRTREAEADLRRAVLQAGSDARQEVNEAFALNRLACLLHETERTEEALPLFERARAIYTARFPDTSVRRIDIADNLALCQLAMGRLPEAEVSAQAALDQAERRFGRESPALVNPLMTRASVARRRGEFAPAETCIRRALALVDAERSGRDGDRARCHNDLGLLLIEVGRAREALVEARLATELGDAAVGFAPRWRVVLLANEADVESVAGDPGRALVQAERARIAALALDPPAHSLAAQADRVRGWVLLTRGDHAGMERACDDAEALLEGVPGRAGALARIAVNRALSRNLRGDGARAQEAVERAFARLHESGEDESVWTGSARYHLGWSKLLRDDRAGAQADFRSAIELLKRLVPEGHPFEAFALNHLAETMLPAQASDALPLLERALAIRRRVLEPEDVHLAIARDNLALALVNLPGADPERRAPHDRAIELWNENLALGRAKGPAPDERLATSLYHLAQLRLERGEFDEAAALTRESLDHARRLYPRGDANVAAVEALLGRALIELDEWSEAAELLTSAWGALESSQRIDRARKREIATAGVELARRRGDAQDEAVWRSRQVRFDPDRDDRDDRADH